MFSISVQTFEPSDLTIDRVSRAIDEEDLKIIEEHCLVKVSFDFDSTTINKDGVGVPSLALSLVQIALALSNGKSHGRIYCNNEPCFFFKNDEDYVIFSRYDPEDISDPQYQNKLSTAPKADVIETIMAAVGVLAQVLRTYAGGKMIRPDDQVWGVLGLLNDNPFVDHRLTSA